MEKINLKTITGYIRYWFDCGFDEEVPNDLKDLLEKAYRRAVYVIEDNAMKANEELNKKIIECFYNIYLRSPRHDELKACGGKFTKIGEYNKYLTSLGYPKTSRGDTYEVVRIRTGEVEFTGSYKDIAEEYDGTWSGVRNTYVSDGIFRCDYKIRLKPFDPELVRKAVEENG